jgi:hypothetical protein
MRTQPHCGSLGLHIPLLWHQVYYRMLRGRGNLRAIRILQTEISRKFHDRKLESKADT